MNHAAHNPNHPAYIDPNHPANFNPNHPDNNPIKKQIIGLNGSLVTTI